MGSTTRLTAEDWVAAGFDALERAGLDAVAVEPLARGLGATKGSFYWHFAGRGELVEAVLERWRLQTEEIIAKLSTIADPRERLRALFAEVLAYIPSGGSEVDLLGRSGPPALVRVRAHVSERRIAFMAAALRETGRSAVEARDRATQLYALWIGHLQLAVAVPETLPDGRGRARLTRSTLAVLAELIG